MNKEKYIEKRIELLEELKELEGGCEGCELHYELNKLKNLTDITNACKACPLGQRIGKYGNKLLDTTKEYRASQNNK